MSHGATKHGGRHNPLRHLSNDELLNHPEVLRVREQHDAAEELAQRLEDYAAGRYQFSQRQVKR
jgi:hypothetical protein